jgi:hypothetical protein
MNLVLKTKKVQFLSRAKWIQLIKLYDKAIYESRLIKYEIKLNEKIGEMMNTRNVAGNDLMTRQFVVWVKWKIVFLLESLIIQTLTSIKSFFPFSLLIQELRVYMFNNSGSNKKSIYL